MEEEVMSTPLVVPRVQRAAGLPALYKTLIIAVVARVVALMYVQNVVLHTLIPPLGLAALMVLWLVVAGVCATRWRWAALLAAVWAAVSSIPGLAAYANNLRHPAVHGIFNETIAGELLLPLVVIVAGVTATLRRNGPADAAGLPRWFPGFLVSVATFGLGAILVAAIPQPATSAGVSPAVLAGLPGLTTANHQFTQREIRAHVGQIVALRLDNSDVQGHAFDVDEFNVHVEMPGGKTALALFTPTTPGTYTFYCSAPGHANKVAGTGMVGKLVVAP
jgi:heme/copper-type cytochrome/quinol oxidase subunit 2